MLHIELDEPLYANGTEVMHVGLQRRVEIIFAECDLRVLIPHEGPTTVTADWLYRVRTLNSSDVHDRIGQELLFPITANQPKTAARITREEEVSAAPDPAV